MEDVEEIKPNDIEEMPEESENFDESLDGGEYYDDGEYASDGNYDDAGYEDDGYYDEQGYDDGGQADYGGNEDKLDRVLNELAAIRYSVAGPKNGNSPNPVYQATPVNVYPQNANAYTFTPNTITLNRPVDNGSLMFNELSSLRNELAMTKNRQEMHIELARLKEEMARDAKLNEQSLLDEIKRLNEKIEAMQSRKTQKV